MCCITGQRGRSVERNYDGFKTLQKQIFIIPCVLVASCVDVETNFIVVNSGPKYEFNDDGGVDRTLSVQQEPGYYIQTSVNFTMLGGITSQLTV